MSDRNVTNDPGIFGALGTKIAQGNRDIFKAVLKVAEAGVSYAQLEVGFAYAKGFCVEKDNRIASEWYEKAAAQGVVNAQFNLGCLHYLGLGCERNVQNALYWFEMAADGGHAAAKQNLVPMSGWLRGEGSTELAIEEHAHWAEMGVDKAMGIVKYDLAHSYLLNLKNLAMDSEVRRGLSSAMVDDRFGIAKASEINAALILCYNISSATPIPIKQVIYCAINEDWEIFENMPKE